MVSLDYTGYPECMILTDCAKGPSPKSLGLDIMGLEPEGLQFLVIVRAERVALEDPVQFLEVAPMEGDDRLRFQHALVPVQPGASWQGPQEPAEPLHGACLLENLDRRHHRLEDDRQGGHTVSRQNSSRSPLILAYLVYLPFSIPGLNVSLPYRRARTAHSNGKETVLLAGASMCVPSARGL